MERMRSAAWCVLVACSAPAASPDAAVDSGTPDTATDDAGGRFSGTVTITSTNAGPTMGFAAIARFQAAEPPPSCATPFSAGDCLFHDCTPVSSAPAYLSGGAIEIDVGGAMITPMRVTDGTYATKGAMALFSGGEMATVTTSGDPSGAPAFMLTAPAAPHVTVVDPPVAVGPVPIQRAEALHFGWLDGTVGIVTVVLEAKAAGGRVQTISCTTPATHAGVVIAAALLSKMPKGNATLDILVRSGASTASGSWDLVFWTANAAVDSNGRDLTHLDATLL
jgi:hypothetical protein